MCPDQQYRQKDCFIFDVDGTLVESNEKEIPFFFESLSHYSTREIDNNLTHYEDRTFAGIIQEVMKSQSVDEQRKCSQWIGKQMYYFTIAQKWKRCDAGFSYLEKAIHYNKKIYFITGNWVNCTYFKLLYAGANINKNLIRSPSLPDVSKKTEFMKVKKETGVSFSKTISFGDSDYDKHIADELRIDFCLID